MKPHLYTVALLVGMVFTQVACDDGEKRSLVNTGDIQSAMPMPAITPAENSPQQVTAGATPGAALNPKHGEPGHRCDIAVGAPLNAAASPATQTTVSPQQPVAPVTQPLSLPNLPVSAGNGAVALNPKHGEPGHRCDIAVGAPLNSQPAAATQPATALNTQPLNLPNTNTPVTSTPSALPSPSMQLPALNSTGSGKLNPNHGEPGHRCDIAVGAPLK